MWKRFPSCRLPLETSTGFCAWELPVPVSAWWAHSWRGRSGACIRAAGEAFSMPAAAVGAPDKLVHVASWSTACGTARLSRFRLQVSRQVANAAQALVPPVTAAAGLHQHLAEDSRAPESLSAILR